MYVVAAIGLLTVALSLVMIANPAGWSRGILHFSRKPYFHAAEIASRLLIGGLLVHFAGETRHPAFMATLGSLFVAVGVFLLMAGASRHRAFAEKSASFRAVFRPAGFVSLALGAFVVSSALGWTFG
jgi:ribose/xylose/arabinose/galactoside ABC-type transport system permease subunit